MLKILFTWESRVICLFSCMCHYNRICLEARHTIKISFIPQKRLNVTKSSMIDEQIFCEHQAERVRRIEHILQRVLMALASVRKAVQTRTHTHTLMFLFGSTQPGNLVTRSCVHEDQEILKSTI